jgi:outer membrane receptor protein involved in Fe transport
VFAGLKGKLASYLSYDVKAALKQENNKALFRSNYQKFYAAENEIYTFGNSFEVVYDNVKTIQVSGGLRSDLSKDIAVGVQATLSKYVASTQPYAWNLPQMELQANAEVAFLPKWSAGTDLFFVGERKDAQGNQIVMPLNLLPVEYTQTLKSYVDANFHLNYKHNERWGAFLKLNNVFNQNYERWLNYPVQGFQILAGASYKFDF